MSKNAIFSKISRCQWVKAIDLSLFMVSRRYTVSFMRCGRKFSAKFFKIYSGMPISREIWELENLGVK